MDNLQNLFPFLFSGGILWTLYAPLLRFAYSNKGQSPAGICRSVGPLCSFGKGKKG